MPPRQANGNTVVVTIEVGSVLQAISLQPGASAGLVNGVAAILVGVNIKPDKINLKGNRVIPVALLGSDTLDVSQIDLGTLTFGPAKANPKGRFKFEDANGDGVIDLVLDFHTRDIGASLDDILLCLTGETGSRDPVAGCDAIVAVIESTQPLRQMN